MTSPLLSHCVELTSGEWQIVRFALPFVEARNIIQTMKSLLRFLAVTLLAPCLIQPASAQTTAHAAPAQSPDLKLGIDILSDTSGVNVAPYVRNLVSDLKKHWSSQTAQSNQQEAVITLTIAPNGQLYAMKLETPGHDSALNQAAWNAAKTTSFSPPPAGMTDPSLKLRVHFMVD
jgi:TonB family protein